MIRLPVYCAGAIKWGARMRDNGTAAAWSTATGDVAQAVGDMAMKIAKETLISFINATK